MNIEVCIFSIEDLIKVQAFPIQRIELCIEINQGGVTPSISMIKKAVEVSKHPIRVLIRPRSGNFHYSPYEFEEIEQFIELISHSGVEGIVFGATNNDNQLEFSKTKNIIRQHPHLKFTFHRAFDVIKDPLKNINRIMELGFDTILTSGGKETASEGLDFLKNLNQQVKNSLTIMPGSGIDHTNCLAFKKVGFDWIHLTSKKRKKTSFSTLFDVPMWELDTNKLEKILALLNH